jgi:hypothetical protein
MFIPYFLTSPSPYSVDAIHALLLVSLWSSVLLSNNPGQDAFYSPDGWLLLSMAISMAQSMQLDQAISEVTSLIQNGKKGSQSFETALEKATVVNHPTLRNVTLILFVVVYPCYL